MPNDRAHPLDDRQNAPENLRILAGPRRRYADRKRAHRWRVAGTLLVAAASPIIVVYAPSWAPWLGAVAGLWVFLSRTLLAGIESHAVEDARRIQEQFDCQVLGLPINPALRRVPSREAIAAAADRLTPILAAGA